MIGRAGVVGKNEAARLEPAVDREDR